MFGFFKKDRVEIVDIGGAFFVKVNEEYVKFEDGLDYYTWSRDNIRYATAFSSSEEAEEKWKLIMSEKIVKVIS